MAGRRAGVVTALQTSPQMLLWRWSRWILLSFHLRPQISGDGTRCRSSKVILYGLHLSEGGAPVLRDADDGEQFAPQQKISENRKLVKAEVVAAVLEMEYRWRSTQKQEI
jgi:hypothetical protein